MTLKELPSVKKKHKAWLGVFGFVLLVGACNQIGGSEESANTTQAAGPAPRIMSAVEIADAECRSTAVVYTGNGTCHRGGEVVTVKRVVDGDTLELADGRLIQLLGLSAPGAKTCAGPGATGYVRGQVEGRQVKILEEPGATEAEGGLLRYVQYPNPDSTRVPTIYSEDLGSSVVVEGWAKPHENGANAEYQQRIVSAGEIAEYRPEGIYGPPCGKPKVFGDDNGNGTADWEDNGQRVDVDVDGNMPDGALTGGFCARKWYC